LLSALGVLVLVGAASGCALHQASASSSEPSGAAAVLFDRSGLPKATFGSPNGNIGCGFSAGTAADAVGTVRCEIIVKDWSPPPKPVACAQSWGGGLSLDTKASVLCSSDTVRGDPSVVTLPYGGAIRFAPFTCSSERSGIDCVNTTTGAGFMIGHDRYQLRNP
jgi:hypothetical protein